MPSSSCCCSLPATALTISIDVLGRHSLLLMEQCQGPVWAGEAAVNTESGKPAVTQRSQTSGHVMRTVAALECLTWSIVLFWVITGDKVGSWA